SEALLLLLAGLFAEKRILFVDPDASAEKQAADLQSAQASAVLVGIGRSFDRTSSAGLPVLSRGELADDFRESSRPRRALDVALLMPCEHGLVLHSHFSIAAMCTSLVTFIPQLRDRSYVCALPLGCWEALTGAFGALLHGLPIVFPTLETEGGAMLPRDRQAYTILLRRQVDAALRRRKKPAALAGLRYMFVSTGAFDAAWRRRAEALFGQAILPVWGLPEVGPMVAPHPTWFPSSSHGLPLVNVSLVPIDPATGKVSLVPWEMLDQAEVCVETLSGMVSHANVADDAALRVGKLFRTHQIASIDNVGVVTLHGEPRKRAPHAS
ncbi:MAG TPA: AMP-binding protein, partial [Candidatus Binatia bacterium]|nr:AMP-binding protein [Candidatus Binatia bacterium]